MFSSGGQSASNGLGNLADELADAWEDGEEDDDEPDMNFQTGGEAEGGITRDSGVDVTSSPVQAPSKQNTLTPPTPAVGRGHRRQKSDYDGSDYGDDSDLESSSIPPGLQSRIDMVESLARRGTENNGTDRDGVVGRVIDGLKDLGGQSGVEGGATRFVSPTIMPRVYILIVIDSSQHTQHYPRISTTKPASSNLSPTRFSHLYQYHQTRSSLTI